MATFTLLPVSSAQFLRAGVLGPVFLLASTSLATAQVFEAVGTRALGMAGAFVAVSDDASAAYWNPAGLAAGAFFSLVVDQAVLKSLPGGPGSRGESADLAGTFAGLSTNTFAASYYRLRINEIAPSTGTAASAMSSSIVTHNVAVTTARVVTRSVSVGSTVRYVRASYGAGQRADVPARRGQNKVDVDVGIKVGGERVQAGLVARNLLKPSLKGLDGSSLQMARQVRAGLSVKATRGLRVAGDVDLNRLQTVSGDRRHVALGAEQWLADWLAVRGGTRVNLAAHTGTGRAVGALGISLALTAGVYLDGHMTRGRGSRERGWSLAGRVGF